MGRKAMTAAQRVQAAIDRVCAHPRRPEDNKHLTELYALQRRHAVQRARCVGKGPAVLAALQRRHVLDLLAVEQYYGDINRAKRKVGK